MIAGTRSIYLRPIASGKLIAISLTLGVSVVLLAAQAGADVIGGLFNTGVDGLGSPLANGSIDSHYVLVGPPPSLQCPLCDGPAVARSTDVAWVAPPSGSKWIGPIDNNDAPGGVLFAYTITFDLTGLDPLQAAISGMWSSDNGGVISINGVNTIFDTGDQSSQAFRSLHSFLITGGFIAGINELTFTVANGGGPTSLLVANIAGSATPIPEPTTLLLLTCGLLGLAVRGRVG